jgi:YfiH family protein
MMIKVADCQAVFLYDPKNKAAAIMHVGWRGSIQNILANAVHRMRTKFHSDPRDIVAGIGPSLGPCCAEFRHWQQEFPPDFARFQVQENHFDFWAISRHQLLEAGLLSESIEVAELCTKCHPEIFYSYRGEGKTGRFAMAIGIKS